MRTCLTSPDDLQLWREQRPTLIDELADALVEVREDGTHVYDQDHPAWSAAVSRGNASRGVGDTIAMVTTALGVAPCARCNRWRAALNRIFPYRRRSWHR